MLSYAIENPFAEKTKRKKKKKRKKRRTCLPARKTTKIVNYAHKRVYGEGRKKKALGER